MHFNTFAAKGVIQLPVTSCSRRDLSVAAAFAANGIGREEGDGSAQRGRSVSAVALIILLLLCVQLNLACQSVLEGLNACFDHRSEVFIPELAMTFKVQHKLTRFFACQNPVSEGGGRKNLPRSFLNRFTQVYMDALTTPDLLFITQSSYPQIPTELLECMVEFNQQVFNEIFYNRCCHH